MFSKFTAPHSRSRVNVVPFQSKAQARKFAAMLKRGEITRATFDEWAHSTNFKKLPERKKVKRGKKTKARKRSKV